MVDVKGISKHGWRQLAAWTGFGTLGCVAVSAAINFMVFVRMGGESLHLSMVSATIIPVILAVPLFSYLTLKLRELAVANRKLEDAATTDRLTMCLNRTAFAAMVEARMGRDGRAACSRGSFLVIDADHFKAINDRYGHDQGDEALQLISAAIKSALRSDDLFGRLGGEEFGVFLPGTSETDAVGVAERIRAKIKATSFRPDGNEHVLTVSVGGAAFSPLPGFAEMFKIADRSLYEAKHGGRDRVAFMSFDEIQNGNTSYLNKRVHLH
jgi:diguanylate cyclase (GGDEF)-like protein